MSGSVHEGSAFLSCRFDRATLFDVTWTSCKLTGSQFPGATLRSMATTESDWSYTSLRGADLSGLDLSGLRLAEGLARPVVSVEYPLAPEVRFPVAIDVHNIGDSIGCSDARFPDTPPSIRCLVTFFSDVVSMLPSVWRGVMTGGMTPWN